jgi:hypothetical protein
MVPPVKLPAGVQLGCGGEAAGLAGVGDGETAGESAGGGAGVAGGCGSPVGRGDGVSEDRGGCGDCADCNKKPRQGRNEQAFDCLQLTGVAFP